MKQDLPIFVKWAGGKRQLLPELKELSPKKIDTYVEPFLGSGALFFFLKKNNMIKQAILSDINEELINLFKIVRDKPDELIELLKKQKKLHSKEYYYKIRALDPTNLNKLKRAARLMYLNKTCFNGLYRVNSKNGFNVPMGSYKNPNIVSEKKIREASKLLKGTIIKCESFLNIKKMIRGSEFVYFDPPYHPLKKGKSFTTYAKGNFLEKEQKQLANLFNELNKLGCRLMLSNSDTKFIKELYKDHKINFVKARRMINSNAKKRGSINELVITNYA